MNTRRATLAFIFVTVALDMLALGMTAPVLPKLVEDFVAGNTARAAEIYGLFGTVWALMQFVFSPVLGALSDRYGRRPVILLSNFGLGLDYIVMALAPTVGWLFVGRVIAGITSASVSAAGAYIADVAPPEKRAAGFGMLSAAFGLGFMLGPALGGVLGNIDPRLSFWVAASFSLINAMYGLCVLPESLPFERREDFAWSRANPIGALTLLRSHVELLALAIVNFIGNIAHEALPTTFVLYVMYRYGWNERTVGPDVSRRRRMFRDRRRGPGASGSGPIRRASHIAGRTPVRHRGVRYLRACAERRGVRSRHRGERTVGTVRSSDASSDDAPSRRNGTRTAARGAQQPARNRVDDRTDALHDGVRSFIGERRDWHLSGAPYLLAALLLAGSTLLAWRVTRSSVRAQRAMFLAAAAELETG